jgi:hypothetical protein
MWALIDVKVVTDYFTTLPLSEKRVYGLVRIIKPRSVRWTSNSVCGAEGRLESLGKRGRMEGAGTDWKMIKKRDGRVWIYFI